MEGIVVELERDDEKHRRVTDSRGLFEMGNLRPGRWILKIYPTNLPEFYFIENSVVDIELGSGDKRVELIRVLPKKRKLKMIQDVGTLEIIQEDIQTDEVDFIEEGTDVRMQYETGISLSNRVSGFTNDAW